MAVYVVTWNLNHERANYDQARRAFVTHLESLDNVADPGLESVRWVSHAGTAKALADFLRQKMDGNDCLFVSRLNSGTYQGLLAKSVWDWINPRI